MENSELRYISSYAHRLSEASGDLSHLSNDERGHFKALLQKFELERKLDEMADRVGQGKLL